MTKKTKTTMMTPIQALVPLSKAELAAYATDIAANVETGTGLPFFSARAGQLSFQGNTFRDNRVTCVLLDAVYENTYYQGRFDAENPVPPDCYAYGAVAKADVREGLPIKAEMVPHDAARSKQNGVCLTCKWNAFKTDERGRGKACKNRVRLALLPFDKSYLAHPARIAEAPVGYYRVSPLGVAPWASYVNTLAGAHQLPPFAVVTTITVTPDPKAQFLPSFVLEEELTGAVLAAVYARRAAIRQEIVTPYPTGTPQAAAPAPAPARKRKY